MSLRLSSLILLLLMLTGCSRATLPRFACTVGTLATSGDGSIYILQERQLVAFRTSNGSYQKSPYLYNVLSGHREYAHDLAAGSGSTGYTLMGDRVVRFNFDTSGLHWQIPIGPTDPLDLSLAIDPTGAVYVPSYIGRSIQVYRANADGTLSHAGAIKGDRTNLTEPDYIAIAPDGKIYVNDHERTIYVYAKGTMGNFPPVATIRVRGVQGSLGPIAVDANLLYIAYADELSRIVALNRLRSGLVRPARTIVGASTQLDFPYAVAVGKDGRLFVANARSQQITIYTKNANGNAPPAGHLSGPSTGLGNPYPTSIALDGRGHLIVGVGDLVRVFSENARGNTRPLLSQTVVQDLPFVSGVSADAEGRLYAVSYPTLSVFSPPVGGKLHLLARTSDSHTHIERPQGLTVDPLGRIYVANASGEVNVFPINAVGNIAPVASIGGKEARRSRRPSWKALRS
jgi:6-phosphogluconolactonase (cycloisomerase 2 family)